MGCYDCVCEKRDWRDSRDDYCQLSTCSTFNNYEDDGWDCYRGECSFYSSERKDFIDYILKVNKHKGDDFDFSFLKVEEYDGGDGYRFHSRFRPLKDLYIRDFWKLLKRQEFWEEDEDFFEKVKNEKVEYIEFYGDREVGLQLRLYDVIDEVVITKEDSGKFELLEMLYFRDDKMKLKDILLYME